MSSSAKSICYIETRNEFHFLLDLTYKMGIVVVVVVVKTQSQTRDVCARIAGLIHDLPESV